jgi:hypothetical protein
MYGMLGPSSLASQPILGQPIQGPGHGSVHSCSSLLDWYDACSEMCFLGGVATQFRNGNLASHPQSLGSPSGMSAYPSVNGTNHMWPPTPVVIPKSSVPLLNAGPSTGTWSQAVARPSIHSQATSTSTSAGAVASAAYSGFFVPVELPSAGPFGLWPIGKNDNAPRNLCGLPNAQGKLCGQMYRRSDVVHHLIQQHGVDEDELRSGKEVNCPDSACRCKSNSCKELPNHTAHIRHLGPHVVGRHRGVRFSCPVSGCGRSYNHERSVDRHTKKDHRMNKAPVSLA